MFAFTHQLTRSLASCSLTAGLLLLAPAGQAELLLNPGFEDGGASPAGWATNDGGGSPTFVYNTVGSSGATTEDVHSGENSVEILDGGPNNARWFTNNDSLFTLEAGKTYEISVWMLREGLGGDDFARISMSGLDAVDGASINVSGNTDGFEKVSFNFTPTQTYSDRRLLLAYNNRGTETTGGRVVFDDASVALAAVPEPGSMALLGLGATFILRKRPCVNEK